MNSTSKYLASTFIVLLLASLLVFSTNLADVQATSKPSVPQFSVQKGTNGVEISIKNSSFTDYNNAEGYAVSMYYKVQIKEHSGGDWQTLNPYDNSANVVKWSGSEYTVIRVPPELANPSSGKLDFRIEALIGYWVHHPPYNTMVEESEFVVEVSSGWSNIKTITISQGYSPLPPSQTTTSPTPSIVDPNNPPQQNLWQSQLIVILVTVCIIILPIAIVTYINKQRKNRFLNDE